MGCMALVKSKGYVVTGTATKLLEKNVHRKGLLVANGGADNLQFAIGDAPGEEDWFVLKDGQHYIFDVIIPIDAIWGRGPGTIVLGEVE